MTAQNGYMEKPYRFVPLFLTGTSGNANFDNFDALRLPTRPIENVPDTRLRHALAVRFLHFIPSADVTLKVDYQFYFDDWSLTAHTVEPRIAWQVSAHIELGLWLRGYRQSGASFWRRTYEVPNDTTVPVFRSGDRDLSPYSAGTVGLRAAWKNDRWGVYVEGSVVQTFFDDFLYLNSLTAVIVQTGLRFTP